MKESKIKALLVKPYYEPQVVEIENTLKSLQRAVGGYIEVYRPFDDNAVIVCNEEGKMFELTPNRGLADKNGKLYEIIVGDFIICGESSDDFISLTDEQIQAYSARFKQPEEFINFEGELIAVPVPPQLIKKPSGMTYRIYQVKSQDTNDQNYSIRHDPMFIGMETLNKTGMAVEPGNYELVYSGEYEHGMSLEGLFQKFNTAHPRDYQGRSMSVSDVIVISDGKKETAHFVDSVGYVRLGNFVTPESPSQPGRKPKRKPPRKKGGDAR